MKINRLLIISVIFGFLFPNNSQHILFTLTKLDNSLQFSNEYKLTKNSNIALQKIFDEFNVNKIEPWLKSAQKDECVQEICLDKIYRIEEYSGEISNLINRLELFSEILYAEPEAINKPYYTPNDQQYNQQWFLPQVRADEAWDLWYPELGVSPGDPSILLASVDTGVDWDHPDLRNSLWNNLGEDANGNGVTIIQQGNTWILDPGDDNNIDDDGNGFIDDLIGWDVSGVTGLPDNNPTPKPGVSTGGTWAHGTHVAGLLNATTDNITGVSSVGFNCKIMSVKSSEEENNPDVYITDGYDGILYAAKAGFYSVGGTIINCSWGSTQFSTSGQAVIDIAFDNYNAVVVAAGGNGVEDGWGEEYTAHYPSSFNHVIAVAPLGTGDSWNNWATYHETIDISSPGENIRSTKIGTGYVNWMGSSMASPIVASSIGLLKAYNPSWKNEQLELMIIETADPIIYDLNPASYLAGKLGKGRVDVYNALTTPLLPKLTFVDVDLFMLEGDDNLIHQGELAQLGVIIWNEDEWGNAQDINIEISTIYPNIIFENSTSFISQISSGGVDINYADPFIIRFENNVTPGEVEFTLTINSNYSNSSNYSVESNFILNVLETPLVLGDLNYDSIINVTDVIILVNIIIGGFTDEWLETGADANQNGNIDVADIITIVGIILGE